MKNFFLVSSSRIVLILLVFVLTASYAHAQLTFGARAGLNLTNFSESYDGKKAEDDEYKPKFKPGFQLGVVAEFALSDNLGIQPGILVATQGAVYKGSEDGYSWKESTNLTYLQIPVNVQYKMDMGGTNLLLQAGPYLGYALGGKYKAEYTEDGDTEKDEEKIEFGTEDEKMNPMDFGLGLGIGLELNNNMQIGLGYNLGLKNLVNGDSKYVVKNNGLVLTVTFLFGK